ncbi:MAG: aquaporin [Pseudomonadota bacterium]
MYSISQKLTAEALGTTLLLVIIVGSGIMGESLSVDKGIALLGNTFATAAGLVVLITVFGPISGAHFNPAVTIAFLLRREIEFSTASLYITIQIIGAIIGVWLAHTMFELPVFQVSVNVRSTFGEGVGELVATMSLLLTIIGTLSFRKESVPYMVGLVIMAGYWFTSSTSFANPAVTIARSLTDTFSGIAPSSVPIFLVAQLLGMGVAVILSARLFVPAKGASSLSV